MHTLSHHCLLSQPLQRKVVVLTPKACSMRSHELSSVLHTPPHKLFVFLCVELLGNCGEAGVPDLVSVLRSIATENIPNLPPGGGLASK